MHPGVTRLATRFVPVAAALEDTVFKGRHFDRSMILLCGKGPMSL